MVEVAKIAQSGGHDLIRYLNVYFTLRSQMIVVAVRVSHTLVPSDEQVALIYAQKVRERRRRGELIGADDLWIGCAGLRAGLPVLTANVADFQRINGLAIVAYR